MNNYLCKIHYIETTLQNTNEYNFLIYCDDDSIYLLDDKRKLLIKLKIGSFDKKNDTYIIKSCDEKYLINNNNTPFMIITLNEKYIFVEIYFQYYYKHYIKDKDKMNHFIKKIENCYKTYNEKKSCDNSNEENSHSTIWTNIFCCYVL
jgi:hypothetical protein